MLTPRAVDGVELGVGQGWGRLLVAVGLGVGLSGRHPITAAAVETWRREDTRSYERGLELSPRIHKLA